MLDLVRRRRRVLLGVFAYIRYISRPRHLSSLVLDLVHSDLTIEERRGLLKGQTFRLDDEGVAVDQLEGDPAAEHDL